MRFEWDATKDSINRRKHGISFASVIPVFLDPNVITVYDHQHSESTEDRWISMGRTDQGIDCVVCHVYRSRNGVQSIRIISARKADRDEEQQYYSL